MTDTQRWWRLLEAAFALRRTPVRRVLDEGVPARAITTFAAEGHPGTSLSVNPFGRDLIGRAIAIGGAFEQSAY